MGESDNYTKAIQLNTDVEYLLVDALYLNDVKAGFDQLSKDKLVEEVKTKIFPYAYYPITELTVNGKGPKYTILTEYIKRRNDNEMDKISDGSYPFTTDAGLIVFVARRIFAEFLEAYDFGTLVDSNIDSINWEYWNGILRKFGQDDICLLDASDINEGFDFCGSGEYKIVLPDID